MARIYKGLGAFFVKISGYRAYIERMERENPGCGEPSGGEIRAYLQKQGNPIDNLYQEAEMDSRYVDTHLAEKITLEDIARKFLVSQSTISQTFRQKMGISFYRYVTQRRLIAAKTEILAGCQLESLYETMGFSDYSTFYRAFRREYGISPSQYRKLQAGNLLFQEKTSTQPQ